jgi:hypothetical protein
MIERLGMKFSKKSKVISADLAQLRDKAFRLFNVSIGLILMAFVIAEGFQNLNSTPVALFFLGLASTTKSGS